MKITARQLSLLVREAARRPALTSQRSRMDRGSTSAAGEDQRAAVAFIDDAMRRVNSMRTEEGENPQVAESCDKALRLLMDARAAVMTPYV